MSPPRRGLLWLAGLVVAVAAVRGLGLALPAAVDGTWCLFRRFVMPCPGCGMTRAMAALGRGDLTAAWSLHPLSWLLLAEASLLALGGTLAAFLPRQGDTLRRFWTAPWVEGAVLVHGALFLSLWTGRAATGSLPW